MKTAKLKTIALLMTAAFLYTTNGMAQRPFGQKDVFHLTSCWLLLPMVLMAIPLRRLMTLWA